MGRSSGAPAAEESNADGAALGTKVRLSSKLAGGSGRGIKRQQSGVDDSSSGCMVSSEGAGAVVDEDAGDATAGRSSKQRDKHETLPRCPKKNEAQLLKDKQDGYTRNAEQQFPTWRCGAKFLKQYHSIRTKLGIAEKDWRR